MGRKDETEAERQARARLKARHAQEVRACSAFFEVADRRTQLEAELQALEAEESAAVSAMAAVSDPSLVAEMVGWSVAKVRGAVKSATDAGGSIDGHKPIHTSANVA